MVQKESSDRMTAHSVDVDKNNTAGELTSLRSSEDPLPTSLYTGWAPGLQVSLHVVFIP